MDQNQNSTALAPIQPYGLADVLKDVSLGRFHDEASEALRALVKQMYHVSATSGGKPKGSITVTLKLTLDRGIIELDPSMTTKTPATTRARTIMYPSPDGRLSKHDARQGELELDKSKDVSSAGVVDIRSASERR